MQNISAKNSMRLKPWTFSPVNISTSMYVTWRAFISGCMHSPLHKSHFHSDTGTVHSFIKNYYSSHKNCGSWNQTKPNQGVNILMLWIVHTMLQMDDKVYPFLSLTLLCITSNKMSNKMSNKIIMVTITIIIGSYTRIRTCQFLWRIKTGFIMDVLQIF